MLLHGIEYRGKHVGWGQVERRFARDAEIVVFACKAAVSETLLRDVAEFFDVTVKGFTTELQYHVTGGKASQRLSKMGSSTGRCARTCRRMPSERFWSRRLVSRAR
jgi:hypothetical protein